MTSTASSGRKERHLPPLLLPPAALSGEEDPEQSQTLRMKVQVLSVTALLLVLLSSAPAPSEALGGHTSTLKRQLGAEGHGEDPRALGDGGDNLPRQGLVGSHPLAGAWEVMGEMSPSSGSPSKALAKPSPGSSEPQPLGKLRRHPRQPSRSRSPGLSHHLKGHGRFNGDTHSCHSIHSRPCQKPSDCGGCLGLYTCRLLAGTCHLKAVSRQRGG
ncbi:PREDICTED: uncharacterized protein LOC106885232 [Calidris pugnax]|uniref:uncharacterized protein LOC106885232 n=1 Tax=Calidris pugnax TaxID=198806 RepID=UPI00071C8325|nr:PREDICTED: uncharacterized protein LOC106885232 [Calidris pugnax]